MLQAKLYQFQQSKRDAALARMYGNKGEIAFGNQIRSYVLYPYRLVRDERTNLEVRNTDDVLNGRLPPFIDATLRQRLERFS